MSEYMSNGGRSAVCSGCRWYGERKKINEVIVRNRYIRETKESAVRRMHVNFCGYDSLLSRR